MTEEEFFISNYPDSCYGNKPLSPHWDFFQSGVEFGERQSEKKIEELERKLEQTEKDLADYQFNYPTIKELQKENAELKKEWQEQVQKATDEGYARTLQTMKLTKAKKLLKKVITDFHNMDCVTVHIDKTIAEAEQFISEVEK